MRVKKAVFPVGGFGSRFLPATKANPKEMLPIVDKPLIQYAVEEAIEAGFTHMIFITNSSKRSIEDHFDNNFELEADLEAKGKQALLEIVQNIAPPAVHFTYVRQNKPQGLGHAVSCAEPVIGDDPFAVLLADELLDNDAAPCLATMAEYYEQYPQSLLAVKTIPYETVDKYGIVAVNTTQSPFKKIDYMIEKPTKDKAPSNLAAIGRYIFTPTIFDCLKNTEKDKSGEIQLTGAIEKLLMREPVNAFQYQGKRHDCGSKLGFLQASVEYGLKHKEFGDSFKNYLQSLTDSSL